LATVRQPVPFGKYLLLDRVSVGGMAEIFKAKSYGVEGFEKIIAIKRILPSMGEDRDFVKMFIDEAKIVGQLSHANICQIFELGRTDGTHFIAMEYIWGKDLLQLQNRLKKAGKVMPPAMAAHIIARVCEGLDYAHRKRDPLGQELKIVHRDCSPQNILISYEGEVKIIDFGIAKAASRSSRTMAGVLKGKFGYMSPEQVRGLPLDRRSDLFALGTVFYEILTRERLFQAESDFSTLEKVRNVDILPLRAVNPDIPEAVEKIVMKALAADPDDRYQWCSEMLADLQRFLMSEETVFSSKHLSSWMKEQFAAELARERQLMEEYKSIGRDGLIAGKPQAEAEEVVDVIDELGEPGPTDGDPTVLGGPNFEEILGKRSGGDDDSADFNEEAPTEIFGEVESNDVPADKVQQVLREMAQPKIQAADAAVPGPPKVQVADAAVLGQAKTLLQPSGSAAVRSVSMAGAAALPLAPGPQTGYGISMPDVGMYTGQSAALPRSQPGPDAAFGSTAAVARLPASPARERGNAGTNSSKPSLVKDVAIGVGIALLVLGLFVAVKYVFFSKKAVAPAAATVQLLGSIEISVPADKRATVTVDGRPEGALDGSKPLLVSDLDLGAHVVEVTAAGATPCRETVTLSSNDIASSVTCPLEPAVTQLVIEGVTAAHDVKLDGKSVPESERLQPLKLEPNTTYDVSVLLGDLMVDRFSVTPEPGQVVRHPLPAPGTGAAGSGKREPASQAPPKEQREGSAAAPQSPGQ
jgi:serine/threonine protein kinase